MSSLLAIELKKTDKVDYGETLRNYIATQCGQDAAAYADPIAQLDNLRQSVRSFEKHESSLLQMQKYYGVTSFLGLKFPIDENQIRINFSWYEVFASPKSGGLFAASPSSQPKVSSFSLQYERACVLFNIAALQSQLGGGQSITSDAGLKAAATYFQASAGTLLHLADVVSKSILPQSADFARDLLSALSGAMLAQAQECVFQKAVVGKMRDAVLCKLAAQASDYYESAANQLRSSGSKSPSIEKSWVPFLLAKAQYMLALAHFHDAVTAKTTDAFGLEIGRLHSAEVALADVVKMKVAAVDAAPLLDRVRRMLSQATKDNDVIYHEHVPSAAELPSLARVSMVKATPFAENAGDASMDLFSALVPFMAHQGAEIYKERRDSLVKEITRKLDEATTMANTILASMNLPAAIEALEQPVGLPPQVLEKSKRIRNDGGIAAVMQKLDGVSSARSANLDILKESERMLNGEESEDKSMRDQFKTNWRRTPSRELTVKLREELEKYRTVLEKAGNSDGIVRQKMAGIRDKIEVLDKPQEELQSAIPQGMAGGNTSNPTFIELKRLMSEYDQLRKARTALYAEVKEKAARDIIGKRFVVVRTNAYVACGTATARYGNWQV
eukprot:Opistho-2@5709